MGDGVQGAGDGRQLCLQCARHPRQRVQRLLQLRRQPVRTEHHEPRCVSLATARSQSVKCGVLAECRDSEA